MADTNNAAGAAASAFPPPPPYYNLYSDLKTAPRPPPPVQQDFTLFGAPYQSNPCLPSLQQQGVQALFTDDQQPLAIRSELSSLVRELGLLLVELCDCLVERPSQALPVAADMALLLKNCHYLLNNLRQHQALATVHHMLELQLQLRKQALKDIKQQREDIRAMVVAAAGCVSSDAATANDGAAEGGSKGQKQQQEEQAEWMKSER